jgi:parvulin-like peptidyl-prolyl cis-trans isomerase-like protein
MPNQLIKFTIILITLLLTAAGQANGGWPWQEKTLVTLDGVTYTSVDFRNWWRYWQEEGQPLPETPELFIDWTLQYREAERMRLFEDPAYQRKIQTFLKTRTLMHLKNEEIDSKVEVSDRDIRTRYEKLYVPLYHLTTLAFADREAADKLLGEIDPASVDEPSLGKLAEDPENKLQLTKAWLRPSSFSPDNLTAVEKLKPGQLSPPLMGNKGSVVLFLHDTSPGSKDDYASVEQMIRQYLAKQQAGELTNALLKKLRRSYAVTVDEQRLQAIDINAPLDSFTDEPLISTKNGDISEKLFMAQLTKQKRFKVKNNFAIGDPMAFKQMVLNGIINQSLTSWEGLARGYETKEPLKDTYTFYSRHRLIKSLESRVLKSTDEISAAEIEQYYQEHIQEFSSPEIIRMSIINGDEGAMNGLWTEVAMGGDFRKLTAKFFGQAPPVREVPANHLEPEVKAVVDNLNKGELSQVFTVKGHFSLLLLVAKKPARTLPLHEVEKQIREKIGQQKAEDKRQEFLARLRGQSTIEINDAVWQQLRKEMEGKNDQS